MSVSEVFHIAHRNIATYIIDLTMYCQPAFLFSFASSYCEISTQHMIVKGTVNKHLRSAEVQTRLMFARSRQRDAQNRLITGMESKALTLSVLQCRVGDCRFLSQ
jgi:hypothetical protein